jgi:hypothetical protein
MRRGDVAELGGRPRASYTARNLDRECGDDHEIASTERRHEQCSGSYPLLPRVMSDCKPLRSFGVQSLDSIHFSE